MALSTSDVATVLSSAPCGSSLEFLAEPPNARIDVGRNRTHATPNLTGNAITKSLFRPHVQWYDESRVIHLSGSSAYSQ